MNGEPTLARNAGSGRLELAAAGTWTAANSDRLVRIADDFSAEKERIARAEIDLSVVDGLDTFGAWSVERLLRACRDRGAEASVVRAPARYRGLLEEVSQVNRKPLLSAPRRTGVLGFLDTIGRRTTDALVGLLEIVAMLGALAISIGRAVVRPSGFRFTSMVHHLDRVGWQAIGIIILITFLIGAIIAQQGIFHFRRFGAEDYVVDLVGILVLREIGVLIVAIMVAGRSGSSYTAELGSMKMREEIDALRTMGRDPVDVLILPRVLALVIALPVLTFIGSMAALVGGGFVSWLYGGMSPEIYIDRLREAVSVTSFKVGMIKAPVMALLIGIVACTEGLKVKGSAESLGLHTTSSVVKAIFLVIVLDGIFAIFFASIGM